MPKIADLERFELGSTTITFLPDGGGIVNPQALYPASTTAGWQAHQNLLDDDGKFITSIGAFIIETSKANQNYVIAVDMGIGPVNIEFPGFGPFFGGEYLTSLQKAGFAPDDITDVLFTHLHLDHCGWVTQAVNGQRELTFPQARYWVTPNEWEFWYGGDNPAGPHPEFVQKPLAGLIQFVEPGQSPFPGVELIDTPGHTPGHISLKLTNAQSNTTLYLLADVLHGAMQIEEADWSVAFDVDAEQARHSREALYPLLTKPNVVVAANHFANAVFGRIIQSESGAKHWQALKAED